MVSRRRRTQRRTCHPLIPLALALAVAVVTMSAASPLEATVPVAPVWTPFELLSNQEASAALPSIAVNGADVRVVWNDTSYGDFTTVVYRHSADGGATWQPPQLLSSGAGSAAYPTIAVTGANVHVAWIDYVVSDKGEVYYRKSADGGVTWSDEQRLSFNNGNSATPALAVSGPDVHVVWRDATFGNQEILYKRSEDAGASWLAFQRLSYSSDRSQHPQIAASGDHVHLVWDDVSFGNSNKEIVYKRSSDGGVTWSTYLNFSETNPKSESPTVAVEGITVHIAWQEYWSSEIMYRRSDDGGATWSTRRNLSATNNSARTPTLGVSGPEVHLAWAEVPAQDFEIVSKYSDDGGLTWSANRRLSYSPGESFDPSLGASGTAAHIVWEDLSFGNWQIVYKHTQP